MLSSESINELTGASSDEKHWDELHWEFNGSCSGWTNVSISADSQNLSTELSREIARKRTSA